MRASLHNIVQVPNFLSSAEVEYFLNCAKTYEIINDPLRADRAMLQIDGGDSVPQEMIDYLARVQSSVEFHCGFPLADLCGIALRKWMPGESQDPHADCEAVFTHNVSEWDMSPIHNFSSLFIEYAALVYLNDDYEGGEIYFPEYGIDIKPKAGDLIFFPGTSMYTHGVREVTSGLRYTLMSFFTTPKLQYIWKYFVLDDSPIRTVEKSEIDSMKKPEKVTKQTVPKSLETFGSNFPDKIDVQVLKRSIADSRVESSILGTSADNVVSVGEFVDEEDLRMLIETANSISMWNKCDDPVLEEWKDKTCGADILMENHPDAYKVLERYARKALAEMEKFYKCNLKYREPSLVRWRAGMHIPGPHADKQNIDGTVKIGFEDWDVSAIIYLNDDYDGGELVFPQHGIKIKPSKGSLVFFPGDDRYIHYVNNVDSGVRWTVPMFYTFNGFTDNER